MKNQNFDENSSKSIDVLQNYELNAPPAVWEIQTITCTQTSVLPTFIKPKLKRQKALINIFCEVNILSDI